MFRRVVALEGACRRGDQQDHGEGEPDREDLHRDLRSSRLSLLLLQLVLSLALLLFVLICGSLMLMGVKQQAVKQVYYRNIMYSGHRVFSRRLPA